MSVDGPSYFKISGGKVSHSEQLDDDAIADYDRGGQLVGIEFLTPEAAKDRTKYLAIAAEKGIGANPPKASPPSKGSAMRSAG